jgi:hypothetical protein
MTVARNVTMDKMIIMSLPSFDIGTGCDGG